jgi:hypothetical protein
MRFDMPTNYRIDIQGHLDERWSDRLAGMHISHMPGRKSSTRRDADGPVDRPGRADRVPRIPFMKCTWCFRRWRL